MGKLGEFPDNICSDASLAMNFFFGVTALHVFACSLEPWQLAPTLIIAVGKEIKEPNQFSGYISNSPSWAILTELKNVRACWRNFAA